MGQLAGGWGGGIPGPSFKMTVLLCCEPSSQLPSGSAAYAGAEHLLCGGGRGGPREEGEEGRVSRKARQIPCMRQS